MAQNRYFPNELPEAVPEEIFFTLALETPTTTIQKLLSMSYTSFASVFERKAVEIKHNVLVETWVKIGQKVENGNYSLYVGALGTAFLLLKTYLTTKNISDLVLCFEIVRGCDAASSNSRDVTFICGRAGVCAIGAVVAKHLGDEKLVDYFLTRFKQINLPHDLPDELLYGRAGFLWACLFINKHVGEGTISPQFMRSVVTHIIENGRRMPNKGEWPLMFEWYGKRYWGAAHGLAGIMHVLMETDLKPDEREDVKNTLICMIKNKFLSGNYLVSEEDCQVSSQDLLVHWCHGAPGIALTFIKAYEVFGDTLFLNTAKAAAEEVWKRGLLKRVGICHGISGNAYVFLSIYRVTGDWIYLYRAKAFASFLIDSYQNLIASGQMHGGDNPYSLFEGIGGMAHLFLDFKEPTFARFPGYEL